MNRFKIIFVSLLFFVLSVGIVKADLLQAGKVTEFSNNVNNVAISGDFDTNASIESMAGTVVRLILSVLGVIFVILAFMAGFDWMRAHGNEEQVRKSKDTLRNLLIGLAIIIACYAISYSLTKTIVSLVVTK